MDWATFQHLPTPEVARLVRAAGVRVCAFPINGTRRWFFLEHPQLATQGWETYLRVAADKHIDIYRLLFDHGVETLLTPIVGPDILAREAAYQKIMEPGLRWFTQDAHMLAFYDAYDVRVHVYGDTRRYFEGTPLAPLLDVFDEIADRTADHHRRRLFFGICAHDAAETVAAIGARVYQQQQRLPTKREIVAAYYGEYVDPVDFFIGFDRFSAFDMPLVSTGSESLYFTVSPSLYLEQPALRAVLYDYLYERHGHENYAEFTDADWQTMADFYRVNRAQVQGIGRQYGGGKFWYPLPQVQMTPALQPAE